MPFFNIIPIFFHALFCCLLASLLVASPAYALPAPIDGTFIYMGYGNQDLSTDLIPAYFDELQSLNFTTIILGSIQTKTSGSGCDGSTYQWHPELPGKLDVIMSEAASHNFQVYIGLLETTNECWPPYNETNKLNVHTYLNDSNNPLNPITYLVNRYNSNPSLKGWYIPDEPGLGWWSDSEVDASLSYYAGYVSAIRKFSPLPILTAPSLAGANGRSPDNFANMALRFKNWTGITTFVWQDSVGEVGFNVDWRNTPTTKDYYAAIASKIGRDNLWTDLELGNCCVSPKYAWDTGSYNPTSIARVLAQLYNSPPEIAAKRIVWIQQYHMTSVSPFQKTGSLRLLQAYQAQFGLGVEYIKPISYTWNTPPENAYPDTGNTEMFDLKTGDPQNFQDARWTDVTNAPQITINIGKTTYLRSLGVHLLHHNESGIHFPDSMTFSCSIDNLNWTPARTWSIPIRKDDSEFVFSNPNNNPINTNCQYVRLNLNNSGWHTFMSEIELIGGTAPTPHPQDFDQDGDIDYIDILHLLLTQSPSIFSLNSLISFFGN